MTHSEHFTTSDGMTLAYRVTGSGRPVILLHGLFSDAEVNWIKYGHAQRIADAGFRVILPDLRAHGQSAAPHDADHYPLDVLARDLSELIAHLDLSDYDLGGFSLGARTSVRGVISGLRPRRLVLGGMGLQGLAGSRDRGSFFRRAISEFATAKRGDDTWMAIQFMKTMKVDLVAADHLLQSLVDTGPNDLTAIVMPTLVVCGAQDFDNGHATQLAAALPDAQYVEIPGTHMSSVVEAALGEAIVRFLTA